MEKFNSFELLCRSNRSTAVEGESTLLETAHAPNRSIRSNRLNSFKWKPGLRRDCCGFHGTAFDLEKISSIEIEVVDCEYMAHKICYYYSWWAFYCSIIKALFQGISLSSRLMFVFCDLTSNVTKIAFLGSCLICFILLKRSIVSLI